MLPPSLLDLLQLCKAGELTLDETMRKVQEHQWSPQFFEETRQWYLHNAPELMDPETAAKHSVVRFKKTSPFLTFVILILTLTTALGSAAYLIASDKIDIQNPPLKDKIDNFILRLPLIPKNPATLFRLATLAHKNNAQNSIDFSFASNSDDLAATLGSNNLDLLLQGYTDFSDNLNPRISFSGSINKEFSVDLKKEDHLLFFRVGKVPLPVSTILGVRPSDLDTLLENWIAFDTSKLETEARKSLEDISDPDPEKKDSEINNEIETFLVDEIMSSFTQSRDRVDEFRCHKLFLNPSPDQINNFVELASKTANAGNTTRYVSPQPINYSEVFRNLNLNIWIDEKDYYIRKFQISTVFDPNPIIKNNEGIAGFSNSVEKPIKMSLVLKFSNFGEVLPIDVPQNYLTPQEFVEKIFDISTPLSVLQNPSGQTLGSPFLISGFSPLGAKSIEKGVTAQINSATRQGDEIVVKVVFVNNISQSTKISPLRLRLKGSASGSAPKPALPLLEMKSLESVEYDFTYNYSTPEPVEWVYLNSDGQSILLASYQP